MCGEVIGGRGKGTGIFGLHTSAHPKMKALSRILGWSFPNPLMSKAIHQAPTQAQF